MSSGAHLKQELDRIYGALRAPVVPLLARHGITTKPHRHFHNLSFCPVCKHGAGGVGSKVNLQCGVSETETSSGLMHAVKCFHNGGAPVSYPEFLVFLGELSSSDLDLLEKSKKSVSSAVRAPVVSKPKPSLLVAAPVSDGGLKRVSEENIAKLTRRLLSNDLAVKYLHNRLITDALIKEFNLGLSMPYPRHPEVPLTENAWVAPLRGSDGRFYSKYVNYTIPGVTIDNRDKPAKAWSPGEPQAYYNKAKKDQTALLVVDGLKDLWVLHAFLKGSKYENSLLIISTTNGGAGLPTVMQDPVFYDGYVRVYAGHDNDKPDPVTGKAAGNLHAVAMARQAMREVFRVMPPGVKDWNDWLMAKPRSIEEFTVLLESADPLILDDQVRTETPDDKAREGRFAAKQVSIVGEYHNGYLYEAIKTLTRAQDSSGELVESYETIVIRSDRTKHIVKTMPAPKGTPRHELVHRLWPDGSLLSVMPEPNPTLTWTWPAIEKWLNKEAFVRPFGAIAQAIEEHLRASVWLPFSTDYTVLTAAVMASYCQQIFDAVPLILVNGPAGSGKSELGLALKDVGCNTGGVHGIASAATFARRIHQTRGLVIIDDLERIADTKDKDGAFDDLVQTLKLSYKKDTAVKMVTKLLSNGRSEQEFFNFFGIKVINNTRGADDILGTRMLVIKTAKKPEYVAMDSCKRLSHDEALAIRNELHTFVFDNVQMIADTYATIFPSRSNRSDEIAAPLKVIASLIGDADFNERLAEGLARQADKKTSLETPEQFMQLALSQIIEESVRQFGEIPTWVSLTQVTMELKRHMPENWGKENSWQLNSLERPETISRLLADHFTDPAVSMRRTTLYGKTIRAYKLGDDFVTKVLERIRTEAPAAVAGVKPTTDYKAFCRGCDICPYLNAGCDMVAGRAKAKGSHIVPAVIPVKRHTYQLIKGSEVGHEQG